MKETVKSSPFISNYYIALTATLNVPKKVSPTNKKNMRFQKLNERDMLQFFNSQRQVSLFRLFQIQLNNRLRQLRPYQIFYLIAGYKERLFVYG